ncbi:MAG: Heme chaperone HemW [Holosporales bacterium]
MPPYFGIYIHWPFCESKCPYCDFNSHVQRSIDEKEWVTAILDELRYYKNSVNGAILKSVFFGGGTPSLMSFDSVFCIIETIKKNFIISDNLEITLEGNPSSVEVEKFSKFKEAGINRISIGIQSFDEKALQFLGRKHSKADALKALDTAFSLFDNVSFDLIYARPDQTLIEWEQELLFALSFKSHHLSLYQLTIEEGTPFFKQYKRKEWDIPASKEATDLYALTEDIMQRHNMPSYEVSNYANPGFECQHNLIYWRYQSFLGIGPGAHGRIMLKNDVLATQNFKSPKVWLDKVKNAQKKGAETTLSLTQQEILEERLLMGFRIFDPIILNEQDLKFINMKEVLNLESEGFLITRKKPFSLKITSKGRLVLNTVLQKILMI